MCTRVYIPLQMCVHVFRKQNRRYKHVLVDVVTAQEVHIDFGITFEQGKVSRHYVACCCCICMCTSLLVCEDVCTCVSVCNSHAQNILVDVVMAEVLHIDFGITFEQGKVS
jgi:hypothetical protein